MNQITPKAEYTHLMDQRSQPEAPKEQSTDAPERKGSHSLLQPGPEKQADPGRAKEQVEQVPASSAEADMQRLRQLLTEGEPALARRADLAELHKRIVSLFETLNHGVGEMYAAKAEQDRTVLSERIDGLETAVNRMEGALRIEFEPVMREALSQVVAEHQETRNPSRWGRVLGGVFVLAAGLAVGTVFHEEIQQNVADLETYLSSILFK